MRTSWSRAAMVAVILALALGLLPVAAPSASAASTTVVISQVYGGGGNSGATYKNDFIELYNLGATTVDLTGWSVQYASSTGSSWTNKTVLAGQIEPGKYFLIQEAAGSAGSVDLPTPNATGNIAMSGTAGKVALVNNSATLSGVCPTGLVDFVGYGSATNCSETKPTNNLSNTTAALRNNNGATDTDNNLSDFTIGAPNPRNTPPPDAAPTVTSTQPANGASNVALTANVTVVFSEAVNVTDPWFNLTCDYSGAHAATWTGSGTTFTIDPQTDFVDGDNCTLTILKDGVRDVDTNDPPDTMTVNFTAGFSTGDTCLAPYTAIPEIQGSGDAVAITQPVTTKGVVVADYEGPSPALRGFYLQDLNGDGDPATSDGIFIFENDNANTVQVGDVVRVSGTPGENQGQSQITTTAASIQQCGTGSVEPTDVTFPLASANDMERYEGMLVRLPQTMYVTEHYQLGRFGEVLLSSGGRLQQPTNVVAPGAAANALQAQNNLNQVLIDDGSQTQNPDPIIFGRGNGPLTAANTLRGGDTTTGLVGVMTYTWGGNSASPNSYRIRPVNALGATWSFEAANPRPAAPEVGGSLRVVTMNTLNFFNTFDGASSNPPYACHLGLGGGLTDCRGADDAAEFDRQWPKTVAAILAANPDVLGLVELENDGYGSDSVLAFLVDKLNAATAPGAFAFIDADAATGQVNALGTDAIKVGIVYKPAKVTPIGATAVLNTEAFVNGGDSAPRNRPSLAQAFQVNDTGARFILDVNHLKSKGSACDAPDALDGQGNCNAVRTNAANLLAQWLASDPTGTGETDILVMGDMNAYALEDPITALLKNGYSNLIRDLNGPDAYSYVFDGQWGYLDHAIGSASLKAQVAGVADFHINSDEPSVLDYNTNFKTANLQSTLYAPDQYRVSDHDPVVVGLNLTNAAPTASAGGPYTANEGDQVTLTATGSDPDHSPVTFAWDLDNNGSFETPGASVNVTAVDGPATLTYNVRVTDATGLYTDATATVTVANLAPKITSAAFASNPVSCGANNATLNVSFIDPGVLDTHTASVNWGDGGSAQSVSPATSPLSLKHTFAAAGKYTVATTVTDRDNAPDSAAATLTVNYTTSGFLQPINPDGTSVFKQGSTIPVKIKFQNCNGSYPSNLAPTIKLKMIAGSQPGLVINEPISTSNADTNGVMRWSGSPDNQYIYNLGTKTLEASAKYQIIVTVPATGQTAEVTFGLR